MMCDKRTRVWAGYILSIRLRVAVLAGLFCTNPILVQKKVLENYPVML